MLQFTPPRLPARSVTEVTRRCGIQIESCFFQSFKSHVFCTKRIKLDPASARLAFGDPLVREDAKGECGGLILNP